MIRRMSKFAVLAALGGLSACGNLGSRFVKAENVSAKGGLIQIAATDNAQLAGTALAIPLGSLKKDTTITVALANTALLSPDLAAGPTVEWGPAGTQFASAAEMQLPYAADSQDEIFIQVEEANGERFEIDPSAGSSRPRGACGRGRTRRASACSRRRRSARSLPRAPAAALPDRQRR